MGKGESVPLRIVLDSNVVVSTLMSPHGTLEWLKALWQTMVVVPLRSEGTTAELARVFSYPKFGLTASRQRTLLDEYIPWCEEIVVPQSTMVPDPRDPNDRPFLELALAGNADALVTGDNDLLVLSTEFSVPIITPRQLRERLAAS